MEEVLTRKGVLIDVCTHCKGVWLDRGELNFFSKNRKALNEYETKGIKRICEAGYRCPKCDSKMQHGRIPSYSFMVEECLSCRGLFFDAHEFKKLQDSEEFQTSRKDSSGVLDRKSTGNMSFSAKLPSLSFTVGAVCLSLYGILFAVAVFFMETAGISIEVGLFSVFVFILLQFYFSPILMDFQLKYFGSLDWLDMEGLPDSFKKPLLKICMANRIPVPRVGIISDKSPQAYTYGRTPYSARLVFSAGMFDLLDEEELETVLAHELGHIKHWDFVVMTVIRIVPLLLYLIYAEVKDKFFRTETLKDKRSAGVLGAALVVSYLFYLISEYLVLFVSRVREYYADRFGCFATGKPNKLITALVKISYGLLSSRTPSDTKERSYEDRVKAVEPMNIMNISGSKGINLVSQGEKENQLNPQAIEEVMKWDLWSPWAFYYELHSTHPLTAKRINAIGSYALSMKQEPCVFFRKEKPESYWDDFFKDIFILSLPYILGLGAIVFWFSFAGYEYSQIGETESSLFGLTYLFLFCFSMGALIRTLSAYPGGGFQRCSVASLLKLIKVSPVHSYPVFLKGRILGRGDAGNVFSEDFILKDQTGIIFLNHEPFGLNILFALFRYQKFQGQEVSVTGWYRRSPSPYVEVKDIQSAGDRSRAYTYFYKMGFCLTGLLIPLIYWMSF